MSKLKIMLAALVAVAMAVPAVAADFKFSGDLNHRFNLYTNQAGFFSGIDGVTRAQVDEDEIDEFYGEIKYRMQTEMATNDGKVKGVYAIELGAMRFGDAAYSKGGGAGWSGDGVNIETRFAYTDIALPTAGKTRLIIGLQPFSVNKYVWSETAMGVQLKGNAGPVDYTLAWMRGNQFYNNSENDSLFEDADGFLVRGDLKPAEGVKLGLFALYERANPGADDAGVTTGQGYVLKYVKDVDYDLYTLGVDGGLTAGNLFANWDLLYQTGEYDDATNEGDFKGYFVHADLGAKLGNTTLTYTGWYASGDDGKDDDVDNFIATDVDTFDSVIFFEGGYTDDNYFSEAAYVLDKGMIFNKIAVDQQVTDKVNVGAALMYVMTAEDLTLADGSKEDKLGTEVDAYVSYKLYPNVEVALNAGYLFADDGMDFWEVAPQQDGKADTDIYRTTMRVRYSF